MAKYRMVQTEFWKNPIVSEEMTPEDRYFYMYLLTNPETTQIGIYRITKKQMAFDMGYSLESIQPLMDRFISHHKLIRYNPETRELAIKKWGKDNLRQAGKPIMDCMASELAEVEDLSLIEYVAEWIPKQEVRTLFESFYKPGCETEDQEENTPQLIEEEKIDDTSTCRGTTSGQKEKEKQKENKKEKQQPIKQEIEEKPENSLVSKDAEEIVAFWDKNGFGFTNTNAKEQLLSWLDDSCFSQPKAVILKAMEIACANDKRKLNYITGILKNWENESLLSVEDIDAYQKNNQKASPKTKSKPKSKPSTTPAGRVIPDAFELNLTAGED